MNMNSTRLDDRINALFCSVFIGLAVAVIASALFAGNGADVDAAVQAKAPAAPTVVVIAATP